MSSIGSKALQVTRTILGGSLYFAGQLLSTASKSDKDFKEEDHQGYRHWDLEEEELASGKSASAVPLRPDGTPDLGHVEK